MWLGNHRPCGPISREQRLPRNALTICRRCAPHAMRGCVAGSAAHGHCERIELPLNARALSAHLRNLAPALPEAGLERSFDENIPGSHRGIRAAIAGAPESVSAAVEAPPGVPLAASDGLGLAGFVAD